MPYQKILRTAESYFLLKLEPEIVEKYSRYFKPGEYDAYGIRKADILLLAAKIETDFPELGMAELLKLGLLFYKHGKHEMGTLANYLLERRQQDFLPKHFSGFKKLFDEGVKNWEHADQLCMHTLPRFITHKLLPYTEFQSWIEAESRWTRRAAPVCMIKIKKTTALPELLSFTEPLLIDRERVVQQGMGWFMRELWWIYPAQIEDYLYLHRNTAARTIIQYATERLSKEERLRFRKDKSAK